MTKRFRRAVGLIHWTSAANPKHGAPECGSTSFSYTDRVEVVTCPRCKARRAFRAAVAAQGVVS